jgi:hypothetical protein
MWKFVNFFCVKKRKIIGNEEYVRIWRRTVVAYFSVPSLEVF